MLLYSVLGGIALLLILLLLVPLEAGADYRLENKVQTLRIRIRILGIPISVKVPIQKDEKKLARETKQEVKEAERHLTPKAFIKFSKELYHAYQETEDEWKAILRKIRARLICKEIYFTIRYGTTNPARTGLLNGAIWTAGTMILKILDSALNVSQKTLEVYPEFNRTCMCIHMKGSFRFRVIDAAIFALKTLKLVKLMKSKIKTEI